jgi:ketosteroid isomerase-like protein
MMKKNFVVILILFACAAAAGLAQVKPELQKLVEAEISFAAAAEQRGTKAAFMEFLADDGIIFRPEAKNGKSFWRSQPESPALLSWRPAWADISSDGQLGYTTGPWELRPNGKNDQPTAFGQYVTIWKKQADGAFKAVLDIGISHGNPTNVAAKTEKSSPASAGVSAVKWKFPTDAGQGDKSVKEQVLLDRLGSIFSQRVMSKKLLGHLADDAVVLREGQMPYVGRAQIAANAEKIDRDFPPDSFLNFEGTATPSQGNLTYAYGVYKLTHKDKSVSRWNFLQIWKYRGGRWQVALDLFMPIPPPPKN